MNDIIKVNEKVAALSSINLADLSNIDTVDALCSTALEINSAMKEWKAEDDKVKAELKRIANPHLNNVGDKVTFYGREAKAEILIKDNGKVLDEDGLAQAIVENFGGDIFAKLTKQVLDPEKVAAAVAAGVLPERFVERFVTQKSCVAATVKPLTKKEVKERTASADTDTIVIG